MSVAVPVPAGRVALVSARFLPMMGGTEMHVAEVAPRLANMGYDVEVLTTDPSRAMPRHATVDGVRIRRMPAWPRNGDLYFAPGIIRMILRRRYDIIHVQGIHTLVAPMAMAAAVATGTPFAVTFHTGGHRSSLRRRLRTAQWFALRPFLRRAAALVAVSRFEQTLFSRALGVPAEEIVIVPNGVSLGGDAVTTAEDPDLIISVGRLEWYKGHHRAIAALPNVLRDRPGARLLILGTGPEEPRLHSMAAALGVAERVTIRHVPPDQRSAMSELLASAGLVVLLSEYEAHPLAVTEALSLGRRVLVADSSGLTEIAESGLARAVPLWASSAETAAAMLQAMSGPPPAQIRMLPSWDDTAEAVHRLYASVLGR